MKKKPPPDTRIRVAMTLTPEQSAALDVVRGSVPASTWAREAVMRAVVAAGRAG